MQNTSSPCIWGRLKILLLILHLYYVQVFLCLVNQWLGHSGTISTKDLPKLNRSATTDPSMRIILSPVWGWRQHRKHLSSFTVTVKEFTRSFCDRLTSGSKRNTLAKRGFVPVPSELVKNTNVSWFWRFLRQPRSYYTQYLGCWIHTLQ